MADLDDFFAKKDRKKGKTVKKFSTAEEIVKKIEDTKVKNDIKVKKDRQPGIPEGEEAPAMPGDEDEWREYEVAKKDYTGLKIQPLTGQEQREGGGGGQDGEGGAGPGQQQGLGQKGPWNKSNEEGGETERPAPVQSSLPPPVAPPAPHAPGGYVPPSLRNRLAQGPMSSDGGPRPGQRNVKMHLPDIHSEEYFPTLGGAEKPGGATKGSGAWTEAAGGGPTKAGAGSRTNQPLSLGNRFTSLTNDS